MRKVLKYVIDGMFFREVMINLFMERDKIIFNEVFGEVLILDLFFWFLKKILENILYLKFVVMSIIFEIELF